MGGGRRRSLTFRRVPDEHSRAPPPPLAPPGLHIAAPPGTGRTQPPPPRLAQPGRALPALPSFPLLPLSVSPAAAPPPPALPASASRESLAPPTAARSTSGARRAGRLAPTPPSPPTRRPLPAGTRRYATAEKGAGAPAAEHVTAGRGAPLPRLSASLRPDGLREPRGCGAPSRRSAERTGGQPAVQPRAVAQREGRGLGWAGPAAFRQTGLCWRWWRSGCRCAPTASWWQKS